MNAGRLLVFIALATLTACEDAPRSRGGNGSDNVDLDDGIHLWLSEGATMSLVLYTYSTPQFLLEKRPSPRGAIQSQFDGEREGDAAEGYIFDLACLNPQSPTSCEPFGVTGTVLECITNDDPPQLDCVTSSDQRWVFDEVSGDDISQE